MPTTYSLPERIAQRAAALLLGQTDAGAAVWRDRQDALTTEDPVAILIELAEEKTEPLGGNHPLMPGVEHNVVGLLVTVCVRSTSWQTVADGVRCTAHALIAADPELRELGRWRRKTCEWSPAGTKIPFGYVSQLYHIQTITQAGDVAIQVR